MSSPAETAIADLLRSKPALLVQAAHRMHRSPMSGQHQRYTDAEVQQMCEGFAALLLEALEARGAHVRTMVMETMIPGLLARGETQTSIVSWNASFMALLACEIVRNLPEPLRDDATDWLAGFSGSYVADVSQAASRPVA